MIDNENNNVNQNSEGDEENVTRAFKWDWTEEKNNEGATADEEARPTDEVGVEDTAAPAEEQPCDPVKEDEAPAEEIAEEPTEETNGETTAEEPKEDTQPEAEAEEPKNEKQGAKEVKGKPKKDRALHLSCILSACSIFLLVAFALSLMLGIFPISGYRVINIGTSNLGPTDPSSEASAELLEDFLNSVVVVTGRATSSISTGTGVIISKDGYIVTNYHVINDAETVSVRLYGEKMSVPAQVVGFHVDDDVAVLKIDRTGLRAAPFADSDDVRYGEKVYAVGNPEGEEFSWSITQGIVSSPRRQLMIYNNEGVLEKKMNVVQTDASVNHGNSGGPLINVRGEIVGIVTLKRSDSAGMGFALPADGVRADVIAIIETGNADNANSGISMPRPLLGITGVGVIEKTYYKNVITDGQSAIEVVDEAYAKKHPLTTFYAAVSGVYASAVSEGADAAKYLKENDIITEVNGNPVATIYDVMDIVNEFNGGDKVTIKYYRNGKYRTVEVTLRTSKDLP